MSYQTKSIPLLVKALGSGEFEGYASTFGDIDSYGDVVVAGAFQKTISQRSTPVKMLWQHNSEEVIGKIIELKEDDTGLYLKGKLNMDVQRGREAYSLLKDNALDAMSIGYTVVRQEDAVEELTKDDGSTTQVQVRMLKEIKLYEVSLVTFPANESALVSAVKTEFEKLSQEKQLQAINIMKKLQHDAPSTEDSTSYTDAADLPLDDHPEEIEVREEEVISLLDNAIEEMRIKRLISQMQNLLNKKGENK